jgi:hypothetical protein
MAVGFVKGNRSGVFKTIQNISMHSEPFECGKIGHVQGICIGPTSIAGDDSFGVRHMQVGILRNNTEGNPAPPCLEIAQPGMWRFKWSIKIGQRRISVRTKQVAYYPNQRPSIVIKANPDIGIPSDIIVTADVSTDWVTIGPVVFTATAIGMTYVELRNNLAGELSSAYFDHIVAS